MKERISALIDGELSGLEIGPCLTQLKSDPSNCNAWETYQLIGDAMRGQVTRDYSAEVYRRLDSEPTVLAPQRRAASPERLAWVALSAAAGVAAIVMVAWVALPQMRGEPAAVASVASVAPVVSGTSGPSAVAPVAVGVENYLWAHQRFSPAIAMQGVAPYVRTVADERGQ